MPFSMLNHPKLLADTSPVNQRIDLLPYVTFHLFNELNLFHFDMLPRECNSRTTASTYVQTFHLYLNET